MRHAAEHNAVVTAGNSIPARTDNLIIGKIGGNKITKLAAQWRSHIESCKTSGTRVILDFTDNHLDAQTELTAFYKGVLNLVDSVVCSSSFLANAMTKYFSGPISCIEDPIEITPQPPKLSPFWPRTILWFGHSSNLPYLANFLPRLQAKVPIRLLILSDLNGLQSLEHAQLKIPQNLLIELRGWSLESMGKAAAESDCCIIPSNPTDPRKAGVSSNRLLTSLALGLPTIANSLASYIPFSEYFSNIDDPSSTNVVINPCAFSDQVSKAQQMIIPRYTMQAIAHKWYEVTNYG